ncbi:MAG: YtxH domain-containing protein [Chloroflexia bacterium]
MRRQGGDASFWFGLVLGVFIGAAVTVVLTPDSGRANRQKLAEKAKEAADSVQGRTRETTK